MESFFNYRLPLTRGYLLPWLVVLICVQAGQPSVKFEEGLNENEGNSSKTVNWVGWPLTKALWGFSPKSQGICGEHSRLYEEHLKMSSLWAVQMLESSSLSPGGLLAGDNYQLGHYDECIKTQAPQLGISGKYCLATVNYQPKNDVFGDYYRDDFVSNQFSLNYNPMESAWKKIKETADPSKKRRNVLFWAVCVPSACSNKQVENSLQKVIVPTLSENGIEATVEVNENHCSGQDPVYPESVLKGREIMKWVIIFSLLSVIIASTIDMSHFRSKKEVDDKNKGNMHSLMLSYSIYENFLNLKKPDPSDEFACLHGMRTYSMFLIILGHRCLFTYGGPFHNPEFLEERFRCFTDMFLLNGTLIVDTFFLLSSFLTCYMLLLEMQKRKKMDFMFVYIYRWTRIVPTYMFVLAFQALVFPTLGNGPIWNAKAGLQAERCRQNWWTNFLFINNYVNSENLCMFQSWFISCDMHFFAIGMVATHLYSKRQRVGILFATVLLGISILVPFLVTFLGKYDGVLRVYMSLLEDPPSNRNYREVYIKTHNRAGSYMIGILAAFLYHRLKTNEFRFKKIQVQLGGVLCAIAALSAMLSAWVFYIPGREYSALESALYASLHRILWSSAMAWIIITGGTTGFGVLGPILSMKALIPLSRLTYSVFLIHGMVQLFSVATVRSSEYITFPKLFWMCFGDITTSFILGLLLHLTIEAPISGIMKIILLPKRSAARKEVKIVEEPQKMLTKDSNSEQKDGIEDGIETDSLVTNEDKEKQIEGTQEKRDKMQIVSKTFKTILEKKEL